MDHLQKDYILSSIVQFISSAVHTCKAFDLIGSLFVLYHIYIHKYYYLYDCALCECELCERQWKTELRVGTTKVSGNW